VRRNIHPGGPSCYPHIPFWEKDKAGTLETAFDGTKERLLDLFKTSASGGESSCDTIFSERVGGRGNLLPIFEKNSPAARTKRREKAPYRMKR
jgi:hypothetical protein